MTLRRPLVRIAGKTEQLPDGDTIAGGGGAGGCAAPAYPALKASIILFDFNPGTRSWTVPDGVTQIRVFVVGAGGSSTTQSMAGGGYSEKLITVTPGTTYTYTVGAPGALVAAPGGTGGTSSFGGLVSATGGSKASAGVGIGGDTNTEGGLGGASAAVQGSQGGGGAAGHRFGNGAAGQPTEYGNPVIGGGFSGTPFSFVDGWGIGLLPGDSTPGGYGVGGANTAGMGSGGLGGGAGRTSYATGGVGGGGSGVGNSMGGPGLVGIEVMA